MSYHEPPEVNLDCYSQDFKQMLEEVAGECMWCHQPVALKNLHVMGNSVFCTDCYLKIDTKNQVGGINV